MDAALWLAATVTPGEDNLDPSIVSPGLGGFLTVFALALATIVLIRSMVGHLRKVQYGTPPGQEPAPRRPQDDEEQTGENL